MSATATIPGLYYNFVRPVAEQSPLRSDVAGFLGRTKRGPVGKATRVEGWREYTNVFGGLVSDALTPYAVRGYFDNLAQTAYVVRLLGEGNQTASSNWAAGELDGATGKPTVAWPGDSGLQALGFTVTATSPAIWANGTTINIRYEARGNSGKPEMEMEIAPPGEPVEILSGLSPATLRKDVNARSMCVHFEESPLPSTISPSDLTPPNAHHGLRYFEWTPALELANGMSV